MWLGHTRHRGGRKRDLFASSLAVGTHDWYMRPTRLKIAFGLIYLGHVSPSSSTFAMLWALPGGRKRCSPMWLWVLHGTSDDSAARHAPMSYARMKLSATGTARDIVWSRWWMSWTDTVRSRGATASLFTGKRVKRRGGRCGVRIIGRQGALT